MYLFVIIGIIIVAVGVAPLNISGKEGSPVHSVCGYILLVMIAAQPALGVYNLLYGGRKTHPELLFRMHAFLGKVFLSFAMLVQVPLGIIKIGWGPAWFAIWYVYCF